MKNQSPFNHRYRRGERDSQRGPMGREPQPGGPNVTLLVTSAIVGVGVVALLVVLLL